VSGEDYIMRSLQSLPLIKGYSGNQIKKNEMDVVFSRCGREESCIHVVGGDTEGRNPLVLYGSIILKRIFKNWNRSYGLD